MKFEPFYLRLDTQREVELLSEALEGLRCDNPIDALTTRNLRHLLDGQLGREPQR